MALDSKQEKLLEAKLPVDEVYERSGPSGMTFKYVSIAYSVNKANEIFKHMWDRETIELTHVCDERFAVEYDERSGRNKMRYDKPVSLEECRGDTRWVSTYIAIVKVTAYMEDGTKVIRTGTGAGQGNGATKGEARLIASKSSVSDATKRGLKTFGYVFGLGLEDDKLECIDFDSDFDDPDVSKREGREKWQQSQEKYKTNGDKVDPNKDPAWLQCKKDWVSAAIEYKKQTGNDAYVDIMKIHSNLANFKKTFMAMKATRYDPKTKETINRFNWIDGKLQEIYSRLQDNDNQISDEDINWK